MHFQRLHSAISRGKQLDRRASAFGQHRALAVPKRLPQSGHSNFGLQQCILWILGNFNHIYGPNCKVQRDIETCIDSGEFTC
jgi:hypothetical protein